jgi:hypothetical protein
VEINAQTESGESQMEKVSLPVHVSPFLMNALLDVSKELNRIGGYSIEKVCKSKKMTSVGSNFLQGTNTRTKKKTLFFFVGLVCL